MIRPANDPQLREWILADMAAAPPAVALSAMRRMMAQYLTGEAATIFDDIRRPVVTVNGGLWPINHEGNRHHMVYYEAIVLPGADHFLMLAHPREFNRALDQAIGMISRGPRKAP